MTRQAHAATFIALFAALGLTFFFMNRQNAYHPTDDGFILAYSWRIANGEIPYRDFLFERTPLTPILFTALMALPDGWQIQAGRLVFYLEIAASGALPFLWAALRLGLRATFRALALAAVGFLFAVHNFPPMPWTTVDGVLFATAAATTFLFSFDASPRRRLALLSATSVLLALAVLAKQSFVVLPILFVGYSMVAAIHSRSWRPLLASAGPGALVALLSIGALAALGALPQAIQQIAATATLRPTATNPWSGDLMSGGITPYRRAISPVSVAFGLVGFALAWLRDEPGRASALLRKLASAGLFGVIVALVIEAQSNFFLAGQHLFFVVCAALAARTLLTRDHAGRVTVAAGACIVLVAWCSSLSFAYQTPLLGLAAGGLVLELSFPRVAWPVERLAVALALVTAAAGFVVLGLEYPYRDIARRDQIADLATIYPRFGDLYTNTANYDRFRELRDLSTTFAVDRGETFVVLPDYPLIHFLRGTRNPLALDWLQPQEYIGNEDLILRQLNERVPVVLVEREFLAVGSPVEPLRPCGDPPPPPSDLMAEVTSHWTLVGEGHYFCVYRRP